MRPSSADASGPMRSRAESRPAAGPAEPTSFRQSASDSQLFGPPVRKACCKVTGRRRMGAMDLETRRASWLDVRGRRGRPVFRLLSPRPAQTLGACPLAVCAAAHNAILVVLYSSPSSVPEIRVITTAKPARDRLAAELTGRDGAPLKPPIDMLELARYFAFILNSGMKELEEQESEAGVEQGPKSPRELRSNQLWR